ncbi:MULTISPECIES: XRE family transcriptional regulator [Rodentibacter]|uniref:Helix-turn-helix transcriptional regulator n=1 Tax=Rodentibacter pneumotropicus TaxID=758 RepID=A0A4S2QJ65_9PAST|nr:MULTISPECIES: helix-turn-helix transcriptional regulator [Pasteurellaceae]TGY50809.1 helix-turn-helix transcriptional regulator [Pasteurella caecimuris]THA00963.1 helix-turn-helix transcriptional regulator [Rodentibacter pneumotropicus]THA08177.1 helix-turn-helix transcriptional regulator [Rodentibacter pneumotropicus]THA09132.1 helix-turn-helix transcriptional regulator [Rodentibacter pneumotropicus]THA17259.1 helix-turn-helix transcriptional regulator [Rodentibacter pneumotropicus]
MTTLADRLATLMAEKGLSQAELARMIGIKQPSVFKILSGQTLNPKNIVEIATALGVNVHWLKTGEGEREVNDKVITALYTEEQDEQHHLRVDLLDVQLAANSTGIINSDYPEVLSRLYFTEEGVQRLLGRTTTQGIYLFSVPTDSMMPTIMPDDLVFIDTKINEYIGDGVYAFNLNGELYIKRLQRLPTGIFRALSDNPLYPPFDITDELFDTAVIIGKFIRAVELKAKVL